MQHCNPCRTPVTMSKLWFPDWVTLLVIYLYRQVLQVLFSTRLSHALTSLCCATDSCFYYRSLTALYDADWAGNALYSRSTSVIVCSLVITCCPGLQSDMLPYLDLARMKSIKDQVNARTIEFKSDKEIIAEVTKSTNREHEPGVGRKLPVGTGSSSRISPEPNQDYCTREQITEIIRQEVADKERWKKAAEEASQQADLAKKQAESANERAARVELVLDKFMGHYNQQQTAVMNPGSSRIPNDDEDGDDQDGNDEDGNGNNEDGNGSDESSSASDAE
ncbi:hypothetical protein Tco_0580298 [Tanacetum coccineum]